MLTLRSCRPVKCLIRRMSSSTDSPVVDLPGLGRLRGSTATTAWSKRKIYQFLGVNYAEAPIGELRFKAPRPVQSWEGEKDASMLGRPCPMYSVLKKLKEPPKNGHLEDCVNLCVYSNDLGGSRPVMVYIHGGGFIEGDAGQFPPNYLLEKDVVLVVPQYRLGPLGFLSTQTEAIPGNAGALDIIQALKWVQENIKHFGGDPQKVTVVGHSAGAGILSAITYSPLAGEELFSKVILQSGGSSASWSWDHDPTKNAREIAQLGGLSAKASVEELNQFLLGLDTQSLVMLFMKYLMTGTPNGIRTIGGHRMTIGGPSNFLPDTPYEILSKGGGRRNLPMMAGVLKNDGGFLMTGVYDVLSQTIGFQNKDFNSFDFLDFYNRILGTHEVTGTMVAYQSKGVFSKEALTSGNFYALIDGLFDICNALFIKGPTFRAVQENAKFNPKQTWLYTFDYRGQHSRFGYGADITKYPFDGGVSHSDDNLYLFPWPESAANLNEEDTKMAKKMVDLWTSFAIDGIPSAPQVPNWPQMTEVVGPYLHINQTDSVGEDFRDEFTVLSREGYHSRKFRKDIEEQVHHTHGKVFE
ncbi:glutactin-like [Phlebotomus argentipes]|uniref:glutactin-like n=1 Tax=Phlebotomus argentipes TaxID=94469 RepID=UPI0028930347|nr:glutactin-like [Phlebotomus argentipes]